MFQRHPRNEHFEWSPHRGPFEILSPAQAQQYDEQGFFLFENAFTRDEVNEVAAEIDQFEHKFEQMLKERFDGQYGIAKADAITFTIHLVARSEMLKAFSKHPVLAGICRDTLGPRPRLYWDQAVYKKPGNPDEFPWHQDNGYTYTEPQQYLTCWVALNDATLENGCPWVVPGLHRLGTLKHERGPLGFQCLFDPPDAVAVPARAGDIVVFSSLTPHRTGPNLTDGIRKSYILQYAPDGAQAWPDGVGEPTPQDDPARQYLIVP
ncbi:MAG: phytanoyl-CoA dioxygenase family protein [Pseudomonadales bacterium]|nr:phytanoyl-CoA dioxygenase family protein [Pseudomonadales bacterium]